MRLGFDLDEVVVSLTAPVMKLANEYYNLDLSKESFSIFDFRKNRYVDDDALNKEIGQFLVYYVCNTDFQFKARPYVDAARTIRYLKKIHHIIYFVTSRPVKNREMTEDWLRKHNIPYDKLIVLGLDTPKGPIGQEYNLDFFMDDRIDHLESMWDYKRNWPLGLCVLDKPWNRSSNKFKRIYGWDEIKDMLSIGGFYV